MILLVNPRCCSTSDVSALCANCRAGHERGMEIINASAARPTANSIPDSLVVNLPASLPNRGDVGRPGSSGPPSLRSPVMVFGKDQEGGVEVVNAADPKASTPVPTSTPPAGAPAVGSPAPAGIQPLRTPKYTFHLDRLGRLKKTPKS